MRNQENIPKGGYRYRFSKKLNTWVRTSFTIEKDDGGLFFRQRTVFSKDKNAIPEKWTSRP